MVKTADQAAEAYRRGIEAFGGAEVYKKCGDRKGEGFLAVAKCLEDAKKTALTTDMMVSKYRAAAGH
ncbi:MAG: hypothetical protein QXU98_12765 [Candidatus Parvarchaeota archaeon]